MRVVSLRRLIVVPSLIFCCVGQALYAAGPANDTARLMKVIEQQQRRLDDQEKQIKEQQEILKSLMQQIQALQAGQEPAQSTGAVSKSVNEKKTKVTDTGESSDSQGTAGFGELKEEVSKSKEDWPGSFTLPGTETRLKISGFAELDIIHDSDAILTPDALVTSAIVTRGASTAKGADGQTNFSVKASRLSVEARTPFEERQLKTFLSVDFFDDFTSTKPELRLREAYGEVDNVLFGGDILMGQTWTTYTSLYSYPNMLEFQGPNALFGARHPMVRWTRAITPELNVKLAGEAPDSRIFEGADSVSRWPDAVAALEWNTSAMNLQTSLLARDLRAGSKYTGREVSTTGWAASLAGRIYMSETFKQDFAAFSFTYGEGIGGVLNDQALDAIIDPVDDDLETIPTLAWFASYQHWWNPKLYSVVSYGEVDQDTLDIQGPTAYDKTRYATANLVWSPSPQWLFGVEAAYGSREDKDGADGSVLHTLFTTRFSF